MSIIYSEVICWGVQSEWLTMPIMNLPSGTIKVRRRFRANRGGKAFVKTIRGIMEYSLSPCDSGLRLSILHGQNGSMEIQRRQLRDYLE